MIKSLKTPSHMTQDKQGNWYLIPQPYLLPFENGLNLESPLYEAHLSKFSRYGVDGPRAVAASGGRAS